MRRHFENPVRDGCPEFEMCIGPIPIVVAPNVVCFLRGAGAKFGILCPEAHEGEKARSFEDPVDYGVGEGKSKKMTRRLDWMSVGGTKQMLNSKRMTSPSCRKRGPALGSTGKICGEGLIL